VRAQDEGSSVNTASDGDADQAPATDHGAMHRLGTLVGASYNLVRGTRDFLLEAPSRALSRFAAMWKRPARAAKREKFPYTQEAIRTIVMEELAQLEGTDGATSLAEFERRLRAMSAAIEALQAKIAEQGAGGAILAADMLAAMDSIKAAETLTSDERNVLVNIFRQNLAIQKPELIDGGVVGR